MGEAMFRIRELVEISDKAEIYEYKKRIELEMENYRKRSLINDENKLTRDLLIKEVANLEQDLESLKVEYGRLIDRINVLQKEKEHMEFQSKKLKLKYENITNSLDEIREKISRKYEEIDEYNVSNESMKREMEDLELAITLEENAISEKKEELRLLEIETAKKEIEKKTLSQRISETITDLKVKSKFRDLIEENIRYIPKEKVQNRVNLEEGSLENENSTKSAKKVGKVPIDTNNRKLNLPPLNYSVRRLITLKTNHVCKNTESEQSTFQKFIDANNGN